MDIFRAVGSGQVAREAMGDVFSWLSKNEGAILQDALHNLGLKMMSNEELEQLVDRIVSANKRLFDQQGGNAFAALMGLVMREARGRAEPMIVRRLLKSRLS